MKTKIITCLMAFLLLLYVSPLIGSTLAEETNSNEEAKALLQKGLTIYEIDREVARLNQQDEKIVNQIHSTEEDIVKQGGKVQETRKHAGKVLRAYYTGDRDSIWLLLFSLKSFSDVLKTFEYLSMIVQNDHRALSNFTNSYNQLKALQSELLNSRVALQQTKDDFLKQRERLVALQEELDKQLAVSTQAKAVQDQIKSLNELWNKNGLPLFRQYFEQLSIAFMALPELVTKKDGSNLGTNGLTLTDQEFNEFLASKNILFQTLSFKFTETNVIATGNKDGQSIDIKGNFKVIENKDGNEVRYEVDQLQFNGFQLPDTTIASLMDEFGLRFIPKKATGGLIEVTGVKNELGKLIIKLKFSF
jgi:peptidoglycan hydrolase CwlO-like protein